MTLTAITQQIWDKDISAYVSAGLAGTLLNDAAAGFSVATFLATHMGTEVPSIGTIKEALMAARAHAIGSRDFTSRVENIKSPDTSFTLWTRTGSPATGKITQLLEGPDQVAWPDETAVVATSETVTVVIA